MDASKFETKYMPMLLRDNKIEVSEELTDLLSDICREVLRAQPSDIYKFIADILESYLIARDNATMAIKADEYIKDLTARTYDALSESGLPYGQTSDLEKVISNHLHSYKLGYLTGTFEERKHTFTKELLEEVSSKFDTGYLTAYQMQHIFEGAFDLLIQHQSRLIAKYCNAIPLPPEIHEKSNAYLPIYTELFGTELKIPKTNNRESKNLILYANKIKKWYRKVTLKKMLFNVGNQKQNES